MTKRSVDGVLPADLVAESLRLFPGAFKCTDIGNAERMVAQYRDQIRYCPPRKRWLMFTGKRWQWDETGQIVAVAKKVIRSIYGEAERAGDEEIRKAIAKHARESEKAARIAAMIQLAQSEDGIAVLPSELDSDPWAFNVDNGTIDLRTGELRQHDRAELITRLSPVTYTASATSELWDRFLSEATGGDAELAAYIQRAIGYSLQGTVTERAFFFAYGPPATSKSTFILAVSEALGDYHAAAAFETWLVQSSTGGNRGDLVRLAFCRLVTSVEVRKGARFDESILKAITGGDEITAAAKYEAEISFRPSFALWLAANDAPLIRDDDEGAWARVRRIPFLHVIPEAKQDRTLREKLKAPEVRAAIVAWAVQGCLAWLQHGLGTCDAIELSTAAYRSDVDRAAGFLDGCCVFEVGATMPARELRDAYESWCRDNGVKAPLTAKELGQRLQERGAKPTRNGRTRGWDGLRLSDGDVVTPGDAYSRKCPIDFSREDFRELPSPAVTADTQSQAELEYEREREAIRAEGSVL